MAKRTNSFEAITWADLWATLGELAGERPLQEAGLRFTEVTDLVQGQLFSQHPMLALRMSRVIELRFTALGAVAYLRTGIPVGEHVTRPETGTLLLGLRLFDPKRGEYVFMKSPRVKRLANWRQNLRRRLREVADQLRDGLRFDPRRETHSLAELMSPEAENRESDLERVPPTAEQSSLWRPAEGGNELTAAHAGWGDLKAAGISLPVWVSAVTSLGLVLAVLAAH